MAFSFGTPIADGSLVPGSVRFGSVIIDPTTGLATHVGAVQLGESFTHFFITPKSLLGSLADTFCLLPSPVMGDIGDTFTLFPAPVLTDYGVQIYTITAAGGGIGGGAAYVALDPLHITMTGGAVGAGDAPNVSHSLAHYVEVMQGGAIGSGSATIAEDHKHFAMAGGAKGSGTATVTAVLLPGPTVYDVSTDNVPGGGAIASGAALVQERIPVIPSGGAVAGGRAVVVDRIPFTPSGGAIGGGSAVAEFVFAPATGTGGVVAGGAAPAPAVVYAIAPKGGASAGGVAAISDRQAFYKPSGGAIAGGSAVAYLLPSGFVPSAANPFGDPFPGWAINYETGAPSRILGLPANSFARMGGVTYVANAGGIYALDAKKDAGSPIRARVMLPNTDWGDARNKRIPSVWVAGEMEAAMVMQVVTNQTDQTYYTVDPPDEQLRVSRVEPGKGVEGRFIQLGFANVAGADFSLESVEVPPSVLKRHGR